MRYSTVVKVPEMPVEGSEIPMPSSSAAQTAAPPLQKVEYLDLDVSEGQDLKAVCDNVGEDGWVLCTVNEGKAYFARAKRT